MASTGLVEGRIHVLPDDLVNQIAAGEVVERPASVAKELVENALDAGARSIVVEISAGGVDLVRVTDDGCGMTAGEAALAVRRHATSKIATLDDLAAIGTLGFRGEALPSIASVSRFALVSRTADAIAATRVAIDGGGEPVVTETGAAPGTTVEVGDLFFNTPARRKFLKSIATESALVTDVVLRAALAHPSLRLTLRRDGKRARTFLPAPDETTRIRQVFPDDSLALVRGEHDGVSVLAMLSSPERARASTTALYLFVNRRPVRDRGLVRAMAHAYGSVLEGGRFPTGVAYIELDRRAVDVNAHPQKAEVRFAKAREVYDSVARVVADGLARASWSMRPVGPSGGAAPDGRVGDLPRSPAWWNERLGVGGPGETVPAGGQEGAFEAALRRELSGGHEPDPWGRTTDGPPYPPRAYPVGGTSAELATAAGDTERLALEPARGFYGNLRFIAQLRRMWVLCEGDDGIYVLDQHAAAERVTFDRLRRAHRCATVETQRLLFPERVELTAGEVGRLTEFEAALAAMGIEAHIIGPTTAAVSSVPRLVARASPQRLLCDVLAELGREGDRAFGGAVDLAMATMACHGSIRGGDSLSTEECQALLVALDDVDFGGHCPHGRPVVTALTFAELERRLGRRG